MKNFIIMIWACKRGFGTHIFWHPSIERWMYCNLKDNQHEKIEVRKE